MYYICISAATHQCPPIGKSHPSVAPPVRAPPPIPRHALQLRAPAPRPSRPDLTPTTPAADLHPLQLDALDGRSLLSLALSLGHLWSRARLPRSHLCLVDDFAVDSLACGAVMV